MISRERPMSFSDEDYIAAVHVGDERIFTQLVRIHIAALTRFALRFTRVDDDAHDAVQEVFARVWELGDSWRPKATVTAYLYSAVRNRMLNIIRSDDASRRMREAWGIEARVIHEREDEESIDPMYANVAKAFDTLTDRQREAIELRYDHELSVRQVSAILGINERATERLIARALKTLRESYATSNIKS